MTKHATFTVICKEEKKPRLHDNQVWKRLVTYCIWCLGSTWLTLRERFYNLHHTRIMNVVQYILKYWAQRFKQMFVSCTLLIPLYDAYVILFLRGWGGGHLLMFLFTIQCLFLIKYCLLYTFFSCLKWCYDLLTNDIYIHIVQNNLNLESGFKAIITVRSC